MHLHLFKNLNNKYNKQNHYIRSLLDRKSTISVNKIASQISVKRVSIAFRCVNKSISFKRIAHV